MGIIISVHSDRGGTGKTLISLTLAQSLAILGNKVCLFDLDTHSPSLGDAFNIEKTQYWVNQYLAGEVNIEKILIDVSKTVDKKDKLFLCPSDPSTKAIRDISIKGRKWNMKALGRLLSIRTTLLSDREFDYIILDTHPGLSYSSINAIVTSDVCLPVINTDATLNKGIKRMISELYDLFEKKTSIIINKVSVRQKPFIKIEREAILKFEELLSIPILGVIPCFCDILEAGLNPNFIKSYPSHLFTKILEEIANKIPDFSSGTVSKRWPKRDLLKKYNEEFIKKVTGFKI